MSEKQFRSSLPLKHSQIRRTRIGWKPFVYLSPRPETAQRAIKTFNDTLEQMNITPTDIDEQNDLENYNASDIEKVAGNIRTRA